MLSREEYESELAERLAALLVAEHRRRAGRVEAPKNSEPATVGAARAQDDNDNAIESIPPSQSRV